MKANTEIIYFNIGVKGSKKKKKTSNTFILDRGRNSDYDFD